MRLININGNSRYKNVNRFRIKWDSKSRSSPQFKIKQFLKKYWEGDVVFEEFPVYGTLLKVDILNATKKIAVEVHGAQHHEYNKFFHKGNRNAFLASLKRDSQKFEWLLKNDYSVVEINEDEVDDVSIDWILSKFNIDIT